MHATVAISDFRFIVLSQVFLHISIMILSFPSINHYHYDPELTLSPITDQAKAYAVEKK